MSSRALSGAASAGISVEYEPKEETHSPAGPLGLDSKRCWIIEYSMLRLATQEMAPAILSPLRQRSAISERLWPPVPAWPAPPSMNRVLIPSSGFQIRYG